MPKLGKKSRRHRCAPCLDCLEDLMVAELANDSNKVHLGDRVLTLLPSEPQPTPSIEYIPIETVVERPLRARA